jgi:hypothetical protein
MRILFFGAFQKPFLANDSLLIKFHEIGHDVANLNLCKSDETGQLLIQKGIPYYTLEGVPKNKFQWLWNIFSLIKYVRNNKIDIVFSHLDPSNLISVIAQYFTRSRFIIVRHHVDLLHLSGHANSISNKLTGNHCSKASLFWYLNCVKVKFRM